MSEVVASLEASDWPGLEEWLKDHPLPGEDMDVNMAELATAFGVSANTVRSWLTQPAGAMPCRQKGSNGREYVLRLSWCYAWRQNQEAEKQSRERTLSAMQGKLFGADIDDRQEGLTPKQVKEVAEARMKHAEASRMLGTLTEIEGVFHLFSAVFEMFRNGAMGMSDRLERELSLSPAEARQVDRAMEELLTSIIEGIEEHQLGPDFQANFDLNPRLVNET